MGDNRKPTNKIIKNNRRKIILFWSMVFIFQLVLQLVIKNIWYPNAEKSFEYLEKVEKIRLYIMNFIWIRESDNILLDSNFRVMIYRFFQNHGDSLWFSAVKQVLYWGPATCVVVNTLILWKGSRKSKLPQETFTISGTTALYRFCKHIPILILKLKNLFSNHVMKQDLGFWITNVKAYDPKNSTDSFKTWDSEGIFRYTEEYRDRQYTYNFQLKDKVATMVQYSLGSKTAPMQKNDPDPFVHNEALQIHYVPLKKMEFYAFGNYDPNDGKVHPHFTIMWLGGSYDTSR